MTLWDYNIPHFLSAISLFLHFLFWARPSRAGATLFGPPVKLIGRMFTFIAHFGLGTGFGSPELFFTTVLTLLLSTALE